MTRGLGQWQRLLIGCLPGWLFLVGLAGLARRATHLFFASPKKSKQKKGDPQSGSLCFASGNQDGWGILNSSSLREKVGMRVLRIGAGE